MFGSKWASMGRERLLSVAAGWSRAGRTSRFDGLWCLGWASRAMLAARRAAMIAMLASIALPSSAFAATLSLSFVSGPVVNNDHLPGILTATGTADGGSELFAFSQTQPCLATVDQEMRGGPNGTNLGEPSFGIGLGQYDQGASDFTQTTQFSPGGDGPDAIYHACGYIVGPGSAYTDPPVATAQALECSFNAMVSGTGCVPYPTAEQVTPSPAGMPTTTSSPTHNPTQGAGGCVVPRLHGQKLAAAKAALAAAGCRTGTVTRRKGKRANRGRVIAQSRRAGARLPKGTRVNLTVGR